MMYLSYIVKRTQIYLDSDQSAQLGRMAKLRGVTSSHLIREALALYLAGPDTDAAELAAQRAAVAEVAGAIRRLPSGVSFVEELAAADTERDRALEERWRSR